jgi:hypothetical protein
MVYSKHIDVGSGDIVVAVGYVSRLQFRKVRKSEVLPALFTAISRGSYFEGPWSKSGDQLFGLSLFVVFFSSSRQISR